MKRLFLTLNCTLLFWGALPLFAQEYKIVGPEAPKPHEATAVQELTDYLAKRIKGKLVIGGKSPVTFHVGDTALAKASNLLSTQLEDEQGVVKSVGDNVIVNGGGTRGALYATYHFLEDCCDIHWWSEFEEYVPTASPLALPALDMKGKPAFSYRTTYRGTYFKGGHRYMARVRQNGDSTQQIEKEFGGSFNYGPPYHCHTFDRYFPLETYFKEHPEYYSLVKGKRRGGQGGGGQLCLTNPDLKGIILEKLFKYIEEGNAEARKRGVPAPRLYDISQNDNRYPCECEKCTAFVKEHNQSGLYLTFVNDIAEEVEKRYPDIYITTLAYFFTELPPKGGIRARKNVIVKLTNTASNRAVSHLDGQNRYFKEFVEQWSKLADNLFIWEYGITFTNNITGLPYASELYYGDLYRHYFDNNVIGIFLQHERPEQADMYELKFFIETKLMEDPYQDVKTLADLFMTKYYGPAAKYMHEYRRLLDEACRKNNGQLGWDRNLDTFDFITDDYIIRCQKVFDDAVAAAGDDSLLVSRVMRARNGLDRLTCFRTMSLNYHGDKTAKKSNIDGKAAYKRLEKYWPSWCDRFDNSKQLKQQINDSLAMFKNSQYPLPQPEQFKDRNYYDFTLVSHGYRHDTKNILLVEDNESPTGRVFRISVESREDYGMPFEIGFYDVGNKKTPAKRQFDRIPENTGYNWFSLGKTVTIPEKSFLYITRAWTVQIHLTGFKELVGKEFEVWVSAKHVGPQFHDGQQRPEYLYIDRMLLVEPK